MEMIKAGGGYMEKNYKKYSMGKKFNTTCNFIPKLSDAPCIYFANNAQRINLDL